MFILGWSFRWTIEMILKLVCVDFLCNVNTPWCECLHFLSISLNHKKIFGYFCVDFLSTVHVPQWEFLYWSDYFIKPWKRCWYSFAMFTLLSLNVYMWLVILLNHEQNIWIFFGLVLQAFTLFFLNVYIGLSSSLASIDAGALTSL